MGAYRVRRGAVTGRAHSLWMAALDGRRATQAGGQTSSNARVGSLTLGHRPFAVTPS